MTDYEFPTLSQLCQSPDDFFGRLDIGALNLICASGLPGSENLDVARMLDWLDEAAQQVDFETRRHWYRFIDSPASYHNSPGYFCCYFLLQVLQEDFGVKYNPARVRDAKFQDPKCFDPDFQDSRDLFIHGIIDGPGGTCGSMPVIYVAVGRRLSYPLKLAETRAHLFFRWEDLEGKRFGFREKFNVEGAGAGISMRSDEHYLTWPEPWSEADKRGGWYLRSLTPAQELAGFLVSRGECLADNGRLAEAIQAYRWACAIAPGDERYEWHLRRYSNRLTEDHRRAIEYGEEQLRRQRKRQEAIYRGTQKEGFPGHTSTCNCLHCREARTTQALAGFPRHGPSCQCRQCFQARALATPPNALGHPPMCQCFHCQQSRHATTA